MINLYPDQQKLEADTYNAWAQGHQNVLAVAPTGFGKTVTLSKIAQDYGGRSCSVAHRKELVMQMSATYAKFGIEHNILASDHTVKTAVRKHIAVAGRSFYKPRARAAVASIGALNARSDKLATWGASVGLWIQDEAHHMLRANIWGTVPELFPNARGLGVTATPYRTDGEGLGRHAAGVFDTLVEGPSLRELINLGRLSKYRVFAPPSDLNRSTLKRGSTGDWTKNSVVKATERSSIMGDVVEHYKRLAYGKLGITFAPSVEICREIAANFVAAGIPAEVVSAQDTDAEREAKLYRFERRETWQLINVDLFGEGFDVPAVEVVSMCRTTASRGLFVQQFGRVLRVLDGKTEGIIIDHAGNTLIHGLPDTAQTYTLDGSTRSERDALIDDGIPLKACQSCTQVFESVLHACPHCGFRPVLSVRAAPQQVAGELVELDLSSLQTMREAVDAVDAPEHEAAAWAAGRGMPTIGQKAHVNRHRATQAAQGSLREVIATWAGIQRAQGKHDDESYLRFQHAFGLHVVEAQALKAKDALALAEKIAIDMLNSSV